MGDSRTEKENSHIRDHVRERHPEKLPDLVDTQGIAEIFEFKVVQRHRSSLGRQIGEAIQIRRAQGTILNDKLEYNRCELPVLSVTRQKKEDNQIETQRQKEIDLAEREMRDREYTELFQTKKKRGIGNEETETDRTETETVKKKLRTKEKKQI